MDETLGDDPPIETPPAFSPNASAAPTDASEASPMLEPHAPHEPIHSWKSFAIHIAAIAVGLLLALALEQSAEAIHHSHQRGEIEAQMHAVLQADVRLDDEDFEPIFDRLQAEGLPYFADPGHVKKGETNSRGDSRGFYFSDPDGHNLEVMTRGHDEPEHR